MKENMKKEARKKTLKNIKSIMKDDMFEPMKKKLQKVTVASNSPEGLEEGLSMAKEILEKKEDMMGEEYACGGKKEYKDGGMSKADKIKELMKRRK